MGNIRKMETGDPGIALRREENSLVKVVPEEMENHG